MFTVSTSNRTFTGISFSNVFLRFPSGVILNTVCGYNSVNSRTFSILSDIAKPLSRLDSDCTPPIIILFQAMQFIITSIMISFSSGRDSAIMIVSATSV